MSRELDRVLRYHRETKHRFNAFARGPGYLDWETQPDPFRRYHGATLIPLDHIAHDDAPSDNVPPESNSPLPAPVNRRTVSQLLYDSLALSAWKEAGSTRWALRVNPSSGNLHPTEGYLLCGPVETLFDTPSIGHYAPKEHALEVRAELPASAWEAIGAQLPEGGLLIGLTSIHWREAWKYGERAYRYCQLDVGHAMAALAVAAAGLGWHTTLLDDVGSESLSCLLGVSSPQGVEQEEPDCLLAVSPHGPASPSFTVPDECLDAFRSLSWQGKPNRLSPGREEWEIIEDVAEAAQKPATTETGNYQPPFPLSRESVRRPEPVIPRAIIHRRRSAVAMDGRSAVSMSNFFGILEKTIAGPGKVPFTTLLWQPSIHLFLFVHRVTGLEPGVYLLLRDREVKERLRSEMHSRFLWERPGESPPGLEFFLMAPGDLRTVARDLSCQQEIASDGCFSLAMIADFTEPLHRFGPWFYPRLFWECGMIGQMLYLGAETAALRGTGIGCFFDDPVHEVLGLANERYQSLYHFTVGKPVEDTRLTTLPPYEDSPLSPL